MKQYIGLALVASCIQLHAQSNSEIVLFDMQSNRGVITLANGKNITNHKGYDNQPSFHATEPIIYYASFNEDNRSDIKQFDFKANETKSVTTTLEREYSPMLTPDGKFISCIIQRDNKAQDLGKYPATGGEPIALIDNLVVGYHAWVDNDRVLLFALGESQTLHLYNVKTKEDKILADAIGRSLHKMPTKNFMSFVKKNSETDWVIMQLNTETLEIKKLISTLPTKEDLCWLPDGRIIMSDGVKLFSIDPKKESEWKEIRITGTYSLGGITRLAANAKSTKLAIVVAE
jgi:Tol biopolymer transport system component